MQEALLAATVQWPRQGVPDNPVAWLQTVAARRFTDDWRSESSRRNRETAFVVMDPHQIAGGSGDDGNAADDTVKLLFLCCHPALSAPSQVALTLRAVGGLSTAQIAAAFLVPESTMAQRISRGKQRIKAAGARFVMPPPAERDERQRAVLHVLYLIFNEGYTASSGPELLRGDLTAEAIRLTRTLHRLLPGDGEVTGLLALMLLTDAHRAARTGPGGGTGAAGRAGPHPVEPGRDRRGDRAGLRCAGPIDAGPLPTAGRRRRRARGGAARAGHRLAADRRALPATGPHRAQPDDHPEPGGRGCHGGRPSRRPCTAGIARRRRASGRPSPTGGRSWRTCWRWPAISVPLVRSTSRPPAGPPACPRSVTWKAKPLGRR